MILTFTNGYRHDAEPERIVAIEYQPTGPNNGLVPFNVFTVIPSRVRKGGFTFSNYDFDWCKRDECLYYHCSGGGGSFYMHPLAKPHTKPRCAVWYESSIVKPTNGGNCSHRPISNRTLERWGYDVFSEPLLLDFYGSKTHNPFEMASEDEVEYCPRCNDHLPTTNLCAHIWYCEKCGEYSVPGTRCRHRRERD